MFRLEKIPTKLLLALVFILLASIIFLLRINQKKVNTVSAWWDETWTYRQAIDIGWTGSDLTDFQVSFDIGTSALINAGKMQTDCDDIRITDSSGNLLAHWIEEGNPGCNSPLSNTKIWTKLPSLPSTGSTIYIYYGNSSAVNVENGDNVFEFFDDFENYTVGQTLPVNSKWTSYRSGTWTITDSYSVSGTKSLTVSGSTGSDGMYWLNSTYQNTVNTLDVNVYSPTDISGASDTQRQGPCVAISNTPAQGICLLRGGVSFSLHFLHSLIVWGSGTNIPFSAATWYNFSLSVNSSTLTGKAWQIGTTEPSNPQLNWSYSTRSGDYFGLTSRSSTNAFDNFKVRKISTSTPSSTPQSEEVTPGPVAYWKFDEGVGSTAHDSTGINHGTIVGATWQNQEYCISENCLYFNGSSNYINIGNQLNMGSNDFSISLWYKTSNTSTYLGILNKGNATGGSSGHGYNLVIPNTWGGNVPLLFIIADGFNSDSVSYTDSPTTDGIWHHVNITKNNSNINMYLDGNLVKQDNNIQTSNIDSTNDLLIGSWGTGSNFFQGFIDEVKIYAYARSSDQVKSDYASGLAGMGSVKGNSTNIGGDSLGKSLSDGLVGYWKLEETTSPSIDYSGRGYNATWTGDATSSSGKFGLGIEQTDGGGGYLSVSDTGDPFDVGTNNFSLAMWFKLDSLSSPDAPELLSKRDGGSFCAGSKGYHLRVSYNNEVEFYVEGENDCQEINSANNAIISDTWYHVIAVYDQQNGSKIYINGQQSGNTVALTAGNTDNAGPLRIGMGANAWEMDGKYDEVRIYNRALSASEVQTLYNWAPGPIGYWNMDENSGTTAYDISGNSNNGTITDATWTNGKIGGALNFDGSGSDQVLVGNVDIFKPATSSLTVMAWVKSTQDINKRIVSMRDGSTSPIRTGYELYAISGSYRFDLTDGTNAVESYSTTSSYDGNWHHVTGIIDRNNNLNKLYVDGILEDSDSISSLGTIYPNDNLLIGKFSTAIWNGQIDDVRIYNYARTQKQILEDMNARSGASKSTLPIAYWSFDEGYGTTANDKVGNNTGTISGATWSNNGKSSKALNFNGTSDKVTLTNSINTPTISISAWINPQTPLEHYACIFSNLSHSNDNGYLLTFTNTSLSNMSFYVGNESITTSNTGITAGNWYHITATWNGITAKIYIDNKLVASGPLGIPAGYNGASNMIGDYANYNFSGLIDEIKIYNYALSLDEVKQDYNQGKSMVMGQSSSNTGSTASPGSSSQEYCIPGDTSACSPPVAEWKFDEGVGTTAYDTSSNSNHAVFGTGSSAPSWTMGKTGNGLNFDGNGDYVIKPLADSLAITGNITLSTWIKTNSTFAGGIISKYDIHSYYVYRLFMNANGTLSFNRAYDGVWTTTLTSLSAINDNTWHYITAVFDSENMSFYIDGKLNNSTPENRTSKYTDVWQDLCIGTDYYNCISPGTGVGYFNGQLDQVRIYDYARTPAQIAWDYNRGKPIAHYKLDEIEGTTAHDSSENNLHGTLGTGTSSPTWVTGKLNNSSSFDGNDYIDLGTNPFGNIEEEQSISAWVKTNSTGTIISKYEASVCGAFTFTVSDDYVSISNGGGATLFGNTDINDNTWHHLLFKKDSSASYLYIDGKLDNTGTTSVRFLDACPSQHVLIGSRTNGSIALTGLIDDVRIYNYALTDKQIQTLYNSGAVSFN